LKKNRNNGKNNGKNSGVNNGDSLVFTMDESFIIVASSPR